MNQHPVVLYVEDDPLSRKVMDVFLRQLLRLAHYTILEDSMDFVEQLEKLPKTPDVVFLDIHVQPLNGFEMLKILRQQERFAQTRIVALTASVMSEEVQQLQSAGFDGCLGKPLDSDTFPDALQRILRGERVWHIFS